MVEVRSLHTEVGEEEGVIGEVRRGFGLCTRRRRGYVLDRSARMILMNGSRGLGRDLHSHLDSGTWR